MASSFAENLDLLPLPPALVTSLGIRVGVSSNGNVDIAVEGMHVQPTIPVILFPMEGHIVGLDLDGVTVVKGAPVGLPEGWGKFMEHIQGHYFVTTAHGSHFVGHLRSEFNPRIVPSLVKGLVDPAHVEFSKRRAFWALRVGANNKPDVRGGDLRFHTIQGDHGVLLDVWGYHAELTAAFADVVAGRII